MEETFKLKAITLDRQAFRESDLSVAVYTQERGRLNFVARGARKGSSKLAGHLEPITMIDIMAVKGRNFDYIGSAQNENIFSGIKNDFFKISLAGRVFNFFKKNIRDNHPDEKLFNLLYDFLNTLDGLDMKKIDSEIFFNFFVLKIMSLLGHEPELYDCVGCGVKISPKNNGFNHVRGGVVCSKCNINRLLTVSDDCIKILRIVILSDFSQLKRIKMSVGQAKELVKTIGSFAGYHIS